MPVNPAIALHALDVQPTNPMDLYARFQQLRALGDEQKMRQMQMQQYQMQMDEANRKRSEEEQIRNAARGAIRPGAVTSYNTGEMNVGGMTLPGRQSSVQGPAQFDRGAFISGVNDINPLAGLDYQNQFAQQDAAQQKAAFEQRKQIEDYLASRSEQERKVFADFMDTMGKAAGAVKMADTRLQPQVYAGVISTLRNHPNPLVKQTVMQAPEQLTPGIMPIVDQWFNEALPMAEMAKKVYPKQTPGVDVPFSPEVAKQKKELAAAGRSVMGGVGGGPLLEADGIDLAAQYYYKTGTLPYGFSRSPQTIAAVIQRAAEFGKQENPNAIGDVAANRITFGGQKSTTTYFTSGAGGKQLTAFNTAITHLDTLDRLAEGLGNGNMQVFNRAAQSWKEQTGNPAPANFAAAVNAMSGEVAAALKASGATDQEIAHVSATFSRVQSPAQLKGAIGTYRELLNSKAEQLKKQYEAGMKGKPAFNGQPQVGDTKTFPNGRVGRWDGKGWVAQ